MASVSNKSSLLQDAIRSPGGFYNQADNVAKQVMTKLGKPLKEFSTAEQTATAQYFLWIKNNPEASMATMDAQFKRLFKR